MQEGVGVFAEERFAAGDIVLESSFFDLPGEFQEEYLPMLEDWFVEEHSGAVSLLRSRLSGSGGPDSR